MNYSFLAGLLWCACAATEDKLLVQLDKDFEAILKTEKDPHLLRRAARLLEETNQSDRWTQYGDALSIIRQTRSKPAIPLLLKYMIKHVDIGNGHILVPAYANALTILTGKEIVSPYRYVADRGTPVRAGVEKLVKTWWEPNKQKLSTDMSKMSREQLQVIVDRLLVPYDLAQLDGDYFPYLLSNSLHATLFGDHPAGRERPRYLPQDV